MAGAALGFDIDWTPQSDGSYSPEQMTRLLFDLRYEPEWREEAAIDAAFYDGDQLDRQTLQTMQEYGMAPMKVNMIKPAIDSVCGHERLLRTDLVVKAEDDRGLEAAEGFNQKYKEATRLMHFDMAVAQVFKDQIKIGIGWLEITRNSDIFEYPYRALHVPWREMWPDWRARMADFSDGRFIVRRKWFDADDLITYFPKAKQIITEAGRGYPLEWLDHWDIYGGGTRESARSFSISDQREVNTTLEEREWRDPHRGRVALFEVLYRVPKTVTALRLPGGQAVEFKRNNPMHVEMARRGAQLVKGPTRVLRQAFYVGPYRLMDHQLATNASHYIPFIANRRDGDGAVYGMVRQMIDGQKAYNARHTRVLYDTTARRVFIDEDAVDDHAATAKEVNRADAYVVLKSDRVKDKGIEIAPNTDISPVTLELMHEGRRNIYDGTGLQPEFHGRSTRSGQSGVAIQDLIGQSQQVLGPIFDNYNEAKLKGGNRIKHLLLEDMSMQENISVNTERAGRMSKKVFLNARRDDGSGRDNDIVVLKMSLGFADAPNSKLYQQQSFIALSEIVKSMPPDIQPILMDIVVRAAQIPQGGEIIERIRQMTGFGPEPEDPREREALMQEKQMQKEVQQRLQEIEMAEREAEAMKKKADAELIIAKTQKLAGADTELTEAKTEHELAKVELAEQKNERDEVQQQADLVETGANLMLSDQEIMRQGMDKKAS